MNAHRVFLASFAVVCSLVCGLLLGGSAFAAIGTHSFAGTFGTEGQGSGQFFGAEGIAVNDATHNVYVADSANNRVEEFDSAGVFLREFNGSAAPTGALEFAKWIAVDNSNDPLQDPSTGDVYVVSSHNGGPNVVYKFTETGEYVGQVSETGAGKPLSSGGEVEGIAVGVDGRLWLAQQKPAEIDSFSNAIHNEFLTSALPSLGSLEEGLAVDSEGDLYVMSFTEKVSKLDSSGNVLSQELGPEYTKAVAVDQLRNTVYLDTENLIAVFRADGTPIEEFGSGHGGHKGIAVDGTTGTVYVTEGSDVAVFTAPLVPDVSRENSVTNLATEGDATFNGSVNPDGVAVTACQFEYGTEAPPSYAHTAVCVPAPGSGSEPVRVNADVTGLEPGRLYHYRLVAENANGSNQSEDGTFIAPARPSVDGESTADVGASSAKLQAQVNPGGAAATYRFEYGPTASYGTSVPVPGGEAGSGVGDVTVGVELQGLEPHTVYHWRVVVGNEVDWEVRGPDQVFTSQASGGPLTLADGRRWELVSPVQKFGMQVVPIHDAVIQAAEDGSAITYYASGPFVSEPSGNIMVSQALSKRGPNGWDSQDIAPSHELPITPSSNGDQSEDEAFSLDLTSTLVEPSIASSLATSKTLYLRDNNSGAYEQLVSAANVLPGVNFGGIGEEDDGTRNVGIHFVTATPDLSRVVLGSKKNLTSEGSTESIVEGGSSRIQNYYEWVGGRLRFLNVLPANAPEESQQVAGIGIGSLLHGGFPGENTRHAISSDGSRVFWSTLKNNKELFLRDVPAGVSVWVNAPREGVSEPVGNSARFQFASADGSKVFFTDPAQLTTVIGGGLYEYDVEHEKLTLLTNTRNIGEAAGVEGMVLGGSENGSYVYLVATGVLSGNTNAENENAEAGSNNLYVFHRESHDGVAEWHGSFIARLAAADSPDWSIDPVTRESTLAKLTARVSPEGVHLAFMSDRSLTGYDNRDVNSGQSDEEVFGFDASSGRLVCASCDPTGARPAGHQNLGNNAYSPPDLNGVWYGKWLAASVPGWTAFSEMQAVYQSRYLSDDGRLFFDSADALVPQDTNGTEDAYEYEPMGVGDCTSGSVTFSVVSGGCAQLISGGTGEQESVFVDASVSGNDVFFVTSERLVGSDVDRAYDLYDAHACSVQVPCFPAGVAVPPACDTADSCKAAPSPQPTVFGSPASATFAGAGNLAPVSNVAKSKAKAKPKKKRVGRRHGRKRVKRRVARRLSVRGAVRAHVNASKRGVK